MLELATIVREVGDDYRRRFEGRMLPSHLRALRDIESCRTAALGGHLYRCDQCAHEQFGYHSCQNRACPKCQTERAAQWLAGAAAAPAALRALPMSSRRKKVPCHRFQASTRSTMRRAASTT